MCSVTKPPAPREQAEYTLLTVSSFVCDCPAPRRWLTQIIKIRSAQRGAEQRKFELLNIEITCNQTSHEQYAAVKEDIFSFRLVLLLNKVIQKSIMKIECSLKYETSILSMPGILN